MASAVAKASRIIIIFFQYRHIGDTADRYRCRQTDSSITLLHTHVNYCSYCSY